MNLYRGTISLSKYKEYTYNSLKFIKFVETRLLSFYHFQLWKSNKVYSPRINNNMNTDESAMSQNNRMNK